MKIEAMMDLLKEKCSVCGNKVGSEITHIITNEDQLVCEVQLVCKCGDKVILQDEE